MKKIDKIALSAIAAAMVMSSVGVINASASENVNSIYQFSVGPSYTGFTKLPGLNVAKSTSNPVHVDLTQATFSVNCRVLGCSNLYDYGANCTCGYSSVQISANQSVNICNFVRDSYNYCNLEFSCSNSYAGSTITGTWVAH